MSAFKPTLYVMGRTPRSGRAITNLRELCDEAPPTLPDIDIIDVLERPDLAEQEKILPSPTLIKELPPSVGERRPLTAISNRRLGLEREVT